MLKRHHQLVKVTLVLGDALGTAAALVAAYAIRFHSGLIRLKNAGGLPPYEPYLYALPIMVAVCLLAYRYNGLYEPRRTVGFVAEFLDIVKATVTALLAIVASIFLFGLPWDSSLRIVSTLRGRSSIFVALGTYTLFLNLFSSIATSW